MDYMETHRDEMKAQYPTFEDYKKNFVISDALYDDFIQYAKKEGVTDSVKFVFSSYVQGFVKENKGKLDSMYNKNFDNKTEFDQMLTEYIQKQQKEALRLKNLSKAPEYIKEYLKFEIARTLYSYGEAYQVFLTSDDTFQKAVDIMKDNKIFKKFKVNE